MNRTHYLISYLLKPTDPTKIDADTVIVTGPFEHGDAVNFAKGVNYKDPRKWEVINKKEANRYGYDLPKS